LSAPPASSELLELIDARFEEITPIRAAGSIAGAVASRVVAVAIHQGRTQQLWQVELSRPEDDKLIARGNVRMQNIDDGG
jgi:hypothetical protein